jgi:uncharacterized protein (DUF2147 family)
MQRMLSVVGLSLVLYASVLILGTLAMCSIVHANELSGEWATQGNTAHVRIERCASDQALLCGVISWLWEPIDADGHAIRDTKNPGPNLRTQPVIGLSLLRDFRYESIGEAVGGQIYNPENGRTYRASLRLRSPDILEVKGCLLFVCDTQIWRRVESLCAGSLAHSVGTSPARGSLAARPVYRAVRLALRLPGDDVGFSRADDIKQLLLLSRWDLEFVQGFLELLGHHAPFLLTDVQMSV